MPQVRIVVPPVLSVARPNLGAGLLKAELLGQNISCEVSYANIWFAEIVGCDFNELVAEKIDTRPLLAEWLFSWALYPERVTDRDDRYIAYAKQHIDNAVIDSVIQCVGTINTFIDKAVQRILEGNPKIVGISTSFQQNTASLAIGKELKRQNPDVVLCLGGANCEGPMGEAISRNFPFVDYVFSGEADLTFPAFAKRIIGEEGRSIFDETLSIEPVNLGQRTSAQSKVIYGAVSPDMDALPIPNYADYFRDLHKAGFSDQVQPTLVFESSRGCWWGAKHHCKFCGLNGNTMSYRYKTPRRVRQELAKLSTQWGIRSFMAADNILNHKTIDEVFDLQGTDGQTIKPRYSLFYEIKANISYDKLSKLIDGGVGWVQPGIESLDDEVLAIMDKGVTALQNIQLLRNCAELGIIPIWNLLWGFPGETDIHYESMARLVPLIEHLSPPRGPFRLRLDRFSPYFERAQEFGFVDARPMRGYEAIYDLPPAELRDLAYFYEDYKDDTESPALHNWCESVAAWRSRHFSEQGRATLALIEIGGIGLIRDTRSSSSVEFLLVEELDIRLVRRFRDPRVIETTNYKLSMECGVALPTVEQSFQKLVRHGVIVVDKDKALSVALDYAFSRDRPSQNTPHPFGQWDSMAPNASSETKARTFNRGHS